MTSVNTKKNDAGIKNNKNEKKKCLDIYMNCVYEYIHICI